MSFASSLAPTRNQLTSLGTQADALGGLRQRANAAINNAPDRLTRGVSNDVGSAVQQQLGDQQTGAVTQDSTLSNALRRAKARVGIAQRGDKAARNQQLKDRLTQARAGIAAQAGGIETQLTGANIRTGVDVGVGRAKDAASQSTADLIGGTLGSFTALLAGNKKDNGKLFDFGKKGAGIFGKD